MKLGVLMTLAMTALSLNAGEIKHRVAYDNCGVDGQQPQATFKSGNYTYTEKDVSYKEVPKKSKLRTVIYGDRKVGLTYGGLKPSALYKLKLRFLSDHTNRIQRVRVNEKVLLDKIVLPKNKSVVKEILIPGDLYKSGKLQVNIETVQGLNSVLSEAELISDTPMLDPHMEIEFGLMPGPAVKGKAIDLNSGKPVAGAIISIAGVKVTSAPDGTFSAKIAASKTDVKVTAEKGTLKASGTIAAKDFEVFNTPRLSPRPADSELISLNGTWNFLESVPANFPQKILALNKKIDVPGEWVMQGYEVKKNTPAAFHRTFTVPTSMNGKRIKLRFDAVYSDCSVYVNGQKAGGHMGGFTPFELDVTDLVKIGKQNDLALTVQNESLADTMASGSKYACHQLGGINRKVTLFALSTINAASLAIRTDLDADYRDAKLNIELQITNESATTGQSEVSFKLTGPSGKSLILNDSSAEFGRIDAGKAVTFSKSFHVSNPKKWDCENPNLYTLTIELSTGHKIVKKFGFKETEVRGAQMFVNGKPIKLRGCNRHEAHPLRGRSLEGDLWRRDVELFRNANINLIRTCHYPPAEELMEAADELGIFVEVEAPYCWEWKAADPTHLKDTVQQNMEMVIRDRNHPSVLFWSIANESAWGPNFAAASEAMRLLDPTRPQTFNWMTQGHIETKCEKHCELANIHYPGYSGPQKSKSYSKRPVYFGEYIHLNAYNRLELASDRGLRDKWGEYFLNIWEQMYAEPAVLGGAIWSGIDDTFYLKDDITVGYGTWGPIDGWRRPKPEWYHTKKVYSPIRVLNKELRVENGMVIVDIENRQDFSNLNRLRVDWKLGNETGSARADIPTKSKGHLILKPSVLPKAGEKLELTFVDPRGFEMDSFSLMVGEEIPAKKSAKNSLFRVSENGNAIAVNGTDINYTIDRKTGLFTSAVQDNKEMKITGPHLMILPLNNAGSTQMTGKTLTPVPFTDTCKNWKATAVQVKGNTVVVKGSYNEAEGNFTYRFNNDGSFTVDYNFTCKKNVNPRQLGIVFDIPAEFNNLAWKRKGFWTTYPKWHIGRLEGKVSSTEGFEATSVGPKTEPKHEWRLDRGPAGSHDFASTKHNIFTASMTDNNGFGLEAVADGDRHTRAWIHGKALRLLISHYSNGGSERFLRRLNSIDDKPLKKGDKVKNSATFRLVK